MKTMKMKMTPMSVFALVMWVAIGAALVITSHAKAASLDVGSIETSASGDLPVNVGTAGTVFVQFGKSKALTERLANALSEQGYAIVHERDQASTVIEVTGELALLGGPKFHRGVKVALEDATEKAIAEADTARSPSSQEVTSAVVGLVATKVAYDAGAGAFLKGINLSQVVTAVGDMTGARGWFNTLVAGDPRGVCLSKCADWKKVRQTAYVSMTVESGGRTRTARVSAQAFSETLAPEQVVDSAMSKVLDLLSAGSPERTALVSKL